MDLNSFFSRDVLAIFAVGFFLIAFIAVSISVLDKQAKRVFTARYNIAIYILDNNLEEVLSRLKSASSEIFDDRHFLSKITDFLFSRLDSKSALKMLSLYKTTSKNGADKIFNKVFMKKKPSFWANLYFADFVNENGSKSVEFHDLFENFQCSYCVEVWKNISVELNRFHSDLLHPSDPVLKERVESKLKDIKVLLG